MPSILTIFAACVFVAALVIALMIVRFSRKDDYYSIALLSLNAILCVVVSTFGKSLIFDFGVNLGAFRFQGSYGDAVHNLWESVLIILILAVVTVTVMYLKLQIDLKKIP
jgi:ABC-type branched-subunit amino acid transport system permease subunit